METVDTRKLLPTRFEPLRNNRWVMMVEGIDAFLVRAVQPPVIDSSNNRRELTISLYNEIGAGQNRRLKSWLDVPTAREGELKFLDPVGNVVELWKFQAKPGKMWFDKLDYGDAGLVTTHVLLELQELEITSPQ